MQMVIKCKNVTFGYIRSAPILYSQSLIINCSEQTEERNNTLRQAEYILNRRSENRKQSGWFYFGNLTEEK
jgi:hypothetical protein